MALGVAVKVDDSTQPTPYESMKMAELRKAAEALGVDVSTAKTKKEVIKLLETAEASEGVPSGL